MNVSDFTDLLQRPEKLEAPEQAKQLEDVLVEYPYFQAARAIHLKGLKLGNSYKYNNALKVTAAYTTDRDVLFDFITSKDFLQNSIADTISGKTSSLNDIETIAVEVLPNEATQLNLIGNSVGNPFPRNASDAEQILNPLLFKSKDPNIDKEIAQKKNKAELALGQPLPFTKKEKYSFSEWMQVTSFKSIERSPKQLKKSPAKEDSFHLEEAILKKKKFDLIDKFITEKPKIKPSKDSIVEVDINKSTQLDTNELMTETLAKVYLEQKKYKKAIQAYKILSLKYPEKSGFFADRIKMVEKVQQENP